MDWQKIIYDLVARGMKQTQIAEYCECGQASISELLSGKNTRPSYDLGAALIELHKRTARRKIK